MQQPQTTMRCGGALGLRGACKILLVVGRGLGRDCGKARQRT